MYEEKFDNGNNHISVIIFQIAWEQFAIQLLDAKEIIQTGQIRRLPKAADFVEGIFNYRGDIIHVINLSKKLNLNDYIVYKDKVALKEVSEKSNDSNIKNNISLNETGGNNGNIIKKNQVVSNQSNGNNDSNKTFIIVVNINNRNIGFFVDRIINVIHVEAKDFIGLSPIFQTSINLKYIKGIIKFKDRPRILIDLHKILSETEQLTIQKEIITKK